MPLLVDCTPPRDMSSLEETGASHNILLHEADSIPCNMSLQEVDNPTCNMWLQDETIQVSNDDTGAKTNPGPRNQIAPINEASIISTKRCTQRKKKLTDFFQSQASNSNTNDFRRLREQNLRKAEQAEGTPKASKKGHTREGKPSDNFLTKIKQINMQKKKSACRTFFQELKFNEILLGQEPYFHKNKLTSVPDTHKAFSPHNKDSPRVCILVPSELGKLTFMMSPFCNRDMITIKCNLKNRKNVLLCSMYLAHEPNKPEIDPDTLKKLTDLTEYAKNSKVPLIIGADSNGHHNLWNSFKRNDKRGCFIADLIDKQALQVANVGNNPTFLNSRGHKSIIDITLTNKSGGNLISDWRVPNTTSLSDHRMITFDIDLGNKWESYARNYKDLDASAFQKAVERRLTEKPFKAKIGKFKKSNIDSSMNYINKILTEAMDEVCPMIKTSHKSKIPWSRDLTDQKRRTKKAKNRKIRAHSKNLNIDPEKRDEITEEWKREEKAYKKAIQEADTRSYREYCSGLSNPKKLAKVPKNRRQHWEELNVLKKATGELTEESEDTLEILAREHFPEDPNAPTIPPPQSNPDDEENQKIIRKVLDISRMDRIIKKLPHNKAPGLDNIRNSMLTAAWASIKGPLQHIFNQCLTYSYCPTSWKTSRGVIIPKEGKDDYTNPRAYRIISLTSNIQKLLERLILDYLEKDALVDTKLTKNQFGFRKRKSTEAAIHRLTRKIEDALQNGQYALGVFLDVEGAFDNIRFRSIYGALLEAKIPSVLAQWIIVMVTERSIILTLHGVSITRKIHKGCPQGGILSPLLWNLTLNTLLSKDQLEEDFLQAFADDLAILIQGCDPAVTMRDIVNRYLKIISRWCTANGVKLSTIKTKVIVFSTLKRKYRIDPIILDGEQIEFAKEVKYLGITYDEHLRWNTHIQNKCQKATKLLHKCRNYIAKTWGLSPARMRWLYKQVILPSISYACFTWVHRLEENANIRSILGAVQKMAALYITGGLKKSPNLTLDIISGLTPIDVVLKFNASKTTLRLQTENNWLNQYSLTSKLISHAKYLDDEIDKLGYASNTTLVDRTTNTEFTPKFTVTLDLPQTPPPERSLIIFTDGSLKKSTNLTGAGFCIFRNGRTIVEQSIHLGELATINQSEMIAIQRAAELLADANTNKQVINFYSDSLNCLLQLNKGYTKSKLTIDTVNTLNKLCTNNQVILHKVAAHTGISGNEKADKLAKAGADRPPIGPEPFIYISWSNIISNLLRKAEQETLQKLKSHNMKDDSKTPLRSYIGRYGTNRLASKNKSSLRIITHMLTDQNFLRNNLSKRDPNTTPWCKHCITIRETARHFISDCPAYAEVRLRIFGVPYISLEQIIDEYSPEKLIAYINKSGRTNSDYFPITSTELH